MRRLDGAWCMQTRQYHKQIENVDEEIRDETSDDPDFEMNVT